MTELENPGSDPLVGLAVGRVALGVAALLGPNALVRAFGMPNSPSLSYLTRIYGARAVALGVGYLAEPPSGRRRWHRIALAVDTSDTVTAIGHLIRRDVPVRSVVALATITGGYMLVGAARLARGH